MSVSPATLTMMDVATRVIGLVGGLVGLVGGILGIVSWLAGRRHEKRAREEQDRMWRMYVGLLEAQRKNPLAVAWDFEVGSPEHKLAEMMVERELLDRRPRGEGYCLHEAVSENAYQ